MTETNTIEPDTCATEVAEVCAISDRPPLRDVEAMLHEAGLRPTRQRVVLAELLFTKGDRHLTAEMLHNETAQSGRKVSLATVYNTLNLFAQMGMLREIGVDGSTTYFDTRTGEHHHFFIEGESEIRDIPMTQVRIGRMATIPEGYEISRVDLVVRLRKR
jgi:Fur family transcriptional regulator, iron response regulator